MFILPRLNIFTSITSTDDLNEYEKYLFKLYMFNSESKLKKKIKNIIIYFLIYLFYFL